MIHDPRTIFYIPDDRQVIVYFEWDGPVGPHHFEGMWKNPEGKVVVISDFQYEAKEKRFGGYWTLALAEKVSTGLWALEARVDGEVAGTHTFQIVAAPRPADAIPTKRILGPSEIYQSAQSASVFILAYDAKGEQARQGSGFFVGDEVVLTAFQVIDGASNLRVVLSDGRRVESNRVLAWNRWQDWVLLKVEAGKTPHLTRAQANSWSVGDHCYALDSPAEGNRVIVDVGITGQNSSPEAGERLNLSIYPSQRAIGGPLLNEFGEVIGVVGGSLLPGASSLAGTRFGYPTNILGVAGIFRGILAVPITLIPAPTAGAVSTTLAELAQRGQFVAPLTGSRNVLHGTLARRVERKGPVPQPVDEKFDFTRRDTELAVFLNWNSKEKIKSTATLQLYDLNNRLLARGKPLKIDLRPNQTMFSTWQVPIANLPPATYRVDILLGEDPVWRSYFRIVE
ncbi:MAG: trypsin-like peptidase domain-containing protein [Acidobacteria bacterium]|nr:trypsin-like peptidase domain-containing protein [Acidobacteriota bacterium]